MRKFHWVGCLAGLLVAAAPAAATFIKTQMPIPEMVGGADTIIVGKVAAVQPNITAALPDRKAPKKEHYQIVEVTVQEKLLGAKGLTRVKVGVQCAEFSMPRGPKKIQPMVNLTQGQEACFFLKRHYSGSFYLAGYDSVLTTKGPLGLNQNYKQDLDQARKCVKLLAAADASLKSAKAEDRMLTVAMLIRKYRGPAPFAVFGQKGPDGKSPAEEPISAEQSKLILSALARADWSLAKEPFPSLTHPSSLFRRLGLTAKDGWTLQQNKMLNPLNGQAGFKAHQEFTAAAKKWLKANAGKYRIKRLVEEGKEKKVAAKPPKKKVKPDTTRGNKDDADQKAHRAAVKLRLIKSLIEDGKTEVGKLRLEQLIKDFPDTPAAEEAKKLLKKLN
jgi:hypothetical protein